MSSYFKVYEGLFADEKIDAIEILLLSQILSYSVKGKPMYAGIIRIANQYRCSRRTVEMKLKNLLDRGYLVRQRHPQGHTYEYLVKHGIVDLLTSENCADFSQLSKLCAKETNYEREYSAYLTAQNMKNKCENITQNNTNNVNNEKIDINKPFSSNVINDLWGILLRQPKWKNKSLDALQISIEQLRSMKEEEAVAAINSTIECNYARIYAKKIEPQPKEHKSEVPNEDSNSRLIRNVTIKTDLVRDLSPAEREMYYFPVCERVEFKENDNSICVIMPKGLYDAIRNNQSANHIFEVWRRGRTMIFKEISIRKNAV